MKQQIIMCDRLFLPINKLFVDTDIDFINFEKNAAQLFLGPYRLFNVNALAFLSSLN